jgi:transcriptional regulator with XRE-family HTH domain
MLCAPLVVMGKDGSSHVKTDKNRRAGLRGFRKVLGLKQEELAALAGVSLEMVAGYERGKPVSQDTDARIFGVVFGMVAKKNPEAVNNAAQPALEAAEKWETVLLLEPGSEAALELEKQTGKSLAELKAQAETLIAFLRSAANIALSLTK